MIRHAIKSSSIAAVGYDHITQSVEVEFKPNKAGIAAVWQYRPIALEVVERMFDPSESAGKILHTEIKTNPNVTAQQVDSTTDPTPPPSEAAIVATVSDGASPDAVGQPASEQAVLDKLAAEATTKSDIIAHELADVGGPFITSIDLQSEAPDDVFRANVRDAYAAYLEEAATVGKIDGWSVTCDLSNNTPETIAKHLCFVEVQVEFSGGVEHVFYLTLSSANAAVSNDPPATEEAAATEAPAA
jgi:hypothetical protein